MTPYYYFIKRSTYHQKLVFTKKESRWREETKTVSEQFHVLYVFEATSSDLALIQIHYMIR